jgi:hypothetical protein
MLLRRQEPAVTRNSDFMPSDDAKCAHSQHPARHLWTQTSIAGYQHLSSRTIRSTLTNLREMQPRVCLLSKRVLASLLISFQNTVRNAGYSYRRSTVPAQDILTTCIVCLTAFSRLVAMSRYLDPNQNTLRTFARLHRSNWTSTTHMFATGHTPLLSGYQLLRTAGNKAGATWIPQILSVG